ncbi:MAG: branched-chain amino acid ABC transporter permease [Caldilineae bacterium]|nr:MAG: branched-chain amino acid ABC transporter permease [Caldilineae bacterium]
MTTSLLAKRSGGRLALLLALALLLIPYLHALATGQPETGSAGLAALHSRAESVYCAKGSTPTGTILLVETLLIAVATLLARGWKTHGNPLQEGLARHGPYLFVFLLLTTIPFLLAWRTGSSACTRGKAFFWESVFIDVFILAILAISYNLLFGFAGIVSFGHAAFFGMGAYTVGLLMKHLAFPWVAAVIVALLVGVVIALIKGVVGLRIRGLYFALFTLAFAEVFFLLAGNRILVDITGAEDGFTFAVPDFLNMTKNRLFFYYLTLVLMALAFWLVRRLMGSPTGQVLRALRDNEERARMLGYNTFTFKLIALVLAGILATGAGVLRGIALKGASPNVLGVGFTFDPLLATIIGGIGTFSGPVLGVFILRLVEQMLRDTVLTLGSVQIDIGERWALILGVIFIIIVLAFPKGIVGTLQEQYRRRKGG